ncbi:MAG: septum formation initiator family protein [Kiritimatiellae bacterium]|nr:septum formation initiator family protein [Kiritimatiellia bacterium]
MNAKTVFSRLLMLVLSVAVVAAVVFLFVPKYRELRELQRTRVEKERQNEQLRKRIQAYRNKQERFQTEDQYVERTAHESGRIKDGEKVFFFPKEER